MAEKVCDFGAMSYADEKIRAKLDAKTRRVKGGPAAMALARVQAVLARNKAERHLRGGAATRRKYKK